MSGCTERDASEIFQHGVHEVSWIRITALLYKSILGSRNLCFLCVLLLGLSFKTGHVSVGTGVDGELERGAWSRLRHPCSCHCRSWASYITLLSYRGYWGRSKERRLQSAWETGSTRQGLAVLLPIKECVLFVLKTGRFVTLEFQRYSLVRQ